MTSNMILGILASGGLVGLTLLEWRARPGAILPLAVHNFVWAAAFAVVGSELVHYSTISGKAWLILLLGILAFNAGFLLVRPQSARSTNDPLGPLAIFSRRAALIGLAAYSLGFAVYLYTVHRHYGIGTLLSDPASIRGDSEVAYLTLVPFWARLLMFLGPLLFAAVATKRAIDAPFPLPARLLTLAYLAVSMLALLQRTNLFLALLWTVSAILFQIQRAPARSDRTLGTIRAARSRAALQTAGVALAGAVALGSFQLVAGALGKDGQQALSTGAISAPLARSGLTSPVIYATGGIPAFSQLVESSNDAWPEVAADAPRTLRAGDYNPQTWGGATLQPFFEVIPLVRPWEAIATFVEIPFYFNVYTWHESAYRDFRVPGVVTLMLVLGAVLARTYDRRNSSSAAFWVGSYLLSLVFMATFVSRFSHTIDIVSVALALIFGRAADRQRRSRPKAPAVGGRPTPARGPFTRAGGK